MLMSHICTHIDTHLPMPRDMPSGLPNVAGQVAGALHMLAASRVIRGVMKSGTPPSLVTCKALLIKREDQMMLYTITVNIGQLSNATLCIKFQGFKFRG